MSTYGLTMMNLAANVGNSNATWVQQRNVLHRTATHQKKIKYFAIIKSFDQLWKQKKLNQKTIQIMKNCFFYVFIAFKYSLNE